MKTTSLAIALTMVLALVACTGRQSESDVKVEVWHSPQGTVRLDYLLGHDTGCKAVTAWLDSIKLSFRDEDPHTHFQAMLIFQNPDFLTYYCHLENLPTDYYEGDHSHRLFTFVRKDGHQARLADLTDDPDALARQVLAHTRLETDWAVEAMGGEEQFLASVRDCGVGVTARGLTFCYPVMEETWVTLCTIPSSECKMDLQN